MSTIAPFLQVALGGAIGSVLRHLAVSAFGAPWAVIAINVSGSFAIGILLVPLSGRPGLSPLLMTGLLGGFTTFSAFSLDSLRLWEAGRPLAATLYAGGSVALSLVAVTLGVAIARSLP
ncbi:fluoride efflux transporter FluC [Pseudogemmobacter sonorensis]|uniref:fluoride efflux transporter FluC n=1 Tax=Pseudogemmobacter sonorensis TaxID=2989681 RepID=UPI0036A550B4